MIIHLKNNEIDRERWNECIRITPAAKPYAYSWYMDIMVPGWEALVADDYRAVFPLPGFKKYGISYLTTPVFLQQLGVFSPDNDRSYLINQFLEHIPDSYRFIDLAVGQLTENPDFRVTVRTNYILELSSEYKKLYEKFSRNCKRNIAASQEIPQKIDVEVKPSEIIGLFRHNKGKELRMIKQANYQRLEKLMDHCLSRNTGRIIGARNTTGKLVYGLFYIILCGNKTMVLLANTPESQEKKTGYYVYNELIKESAGTNTFFDFSGSSIPSIARFMESFGSKNVPYYRIYRNRLPWPIKGIMAIRRYGNKALQP